MWSAIQHDYVSDTGSLCTQSSKIAEIQLRRLSHPVCDHTISLQFGKAHSRSPCEWVSSWDTCVCESYKDHQCLRKCSGRARVMSDTMAWQGPGSARHICDVQHVERISGPNQRGPVLHIAQLLTYYTLQSLSGNQLSSKFPMNTSCQLPVRPADLQALQQSCQTVKSCPVVLRRLLRGLICTDR